LGFFAASGKEVKEKLTANDYKQKPVDYWLPIFEKQNCELESNRFFL
jgi:hypothetical protein